MIQVERSQDSQLPIETETVVRAAEATLRHQSVPEGDSITVVLTGDEEIQELNRQYRGLDAPTDVLSFQAGYLDPEDGSTYLGDIVLSISQAQAQAQSRGHSLADEIQLLVVHGVLHLLGYDHADPQEKARMWAAQAEILAQLGVPTSVLDQADSPSPHA
jgi:probable rRNA maturation factor